MALRSLHDVIAAIYDAALDATAWTAALALTAETLDGFRAIAYFDDGSENNAEIKGPFEFDEGDIAYSTYYWQRDPIRPCLLASPSGVYLDGILLDKETFCSTEFYSDYRRRYNVAEILHGRILQGAGAGLVNIFRSADQGDFEQEHVEALSVLLPHFGRAMRIQQGLQIARVTADSAVEVLDGLQQAVFLVAASGAILLANRAGEALLRGADGLRADRTGLLGATAAATNSLRRLVAQAAAVKGGERLGGSMRLMRPSSRRPLSVMVTPLRPGVPVAWVPTGLPAAMVLVTDPDAAIPSTEQLRDMFGLTACEGRMALQIASGAGVKAAARALGVAPSTARTHLLRVFAKTGTGRQAELAALLAAMPPTTRA